jgi:hypothetical protein
MIILAVFRRTQNGLFKAIIKFKIIIYKWVLKTIMLCMMILIAKMIHKNQVKVKSIVKMKINNHFKISK